MALILPPLCFLYYVGETRPDFSKVGNRVCTTMPLLPRVPVFLILVPLDTNISLKYDEKDNLSKLYKNLVRITFRGEKYRTIIF